MRRDEDNYRIASVCALLAAVILLASLAAHGDPQPALPDLTPAQAIIVNCAGWKPIFLNDADHVTQATLTEIEQHDDHGAALGCWKLH